MADTNLATYLNDHLAGSVAALELLDHLRSAYAETPIEGFIAQLYSDIDADVAELKTVMKRLDVAEHRTRKVAAWFTEKLARLKLKVDPLAGDLQLFEGLEVLAIGIEGKRALWEALNVVAEESPALRLADYSMLSQRAAEQRARVEHERLKAAKAALLEESAARQSV
jgi:hypothetical protein